ncbi:MAG: hypothetical protein AB7H77_00645 [Bdellovibrionales bacterium]
MSNTPPASAEPTWTLLLFLAVVAFFGFIIWVLLRVQLLEFLRYVRLSELFFIGLFTDKQDYCFDWLKQASIALVDPTNEGMDLAQKCFGDIGALPPEKAMDFYYLTGHSMASIGRKVAYYTHFPMLIAMICVAVYAIFYSPRNSFRRRHDLESFIRTQAKMWPVISPNVDFKPASLSARIPGSKIPDQLAPFAEALSPEEWISFHRIHMVNGIPDREETRRALILQLGPRWRGVGGLPPYMRALIAAFALKGVQKREDSDNLLSRLALCWNIKTGFKMAPDITRDIERYLKDKEISEEIERIGSQHAYRMTAILGILKWARMMGGVLASAQFLWLRAVDRNLWYALNNLGRRSFHAEGSGAIAHFMAEQNAKKPLPIPRVDTAIVAINQFLVDPDKHAIAIPPREEPKAKT